MKEIKKYVKQNSCINNELARNDALKDLFDTSSINIVSKKDKAKGGTYVTCSIKYPRVNKFNVPEEDCELDIKDKVWNIVDGDKLTAFDRRVHDAVGTLWLNGEKAFSLRRLYQIVCGKQDIRFGSNEADKIYSSIQKLCNIRVDLDLTEELKKHLVNRQILEDAEIISHSKKLEKYTYVSRMLNVDEHIFDVIDSKEAYKHTVIRLIKEPVLLTYNRAKGNGSLIGIPMNVMAFVGFNCTEKNIVFQDVLASRVIHLKNKQMNNPCIRYERIYSENGLVMPEDKQGRKTDRKAIGKILDYWKSIGFIDDYENYYDGNKIVGIKFNIPETKTA